MTFLSTIMFALLAVPAAVSACEGECIVGITKAFIGNYSDPLQQVMKITNDRINNLLPHYAAASPPTQFLAPLEAAYSNMSYTSMESAIFPSYFHGKCQQDGIDPPGCPNPDCPVVCGTPGSLVHFYSKLRSIAFNSTQTDVKTLTTSDSSSYREIEKKVVAAASKKERRMLRFDRRPVLARVSSNVLPSVEQRSAEDTKTELKKIMDEMPKLLEQACGGESGLPKCSWESRMKEYILSFP